MENIAKKISWIWFSINLILFFLGVFALFSINADYTHYSRSCIIIAKNQSEHLYKSKSYPDYYFTVLWQDRNKERETFGVSPECYFDTNIQERVYFSRLQPKYEWLKGDGGFLMIISIAIIWFTSGILALNRRGYFL